MFIVDYPLTAYRSVSRLAKRIIGSRNERMLKRLRPRADGAETVEPEVRALSDEQMRARADDLRAKIRPLVEEIDAPYRQLSPEDRRFRQKEHRSQVARVDRQIADLYFEEASALVREASRRAKDHRHFHCQIIGGFVLYDGSIAEMKTGEGKTIVCHVAAFLKVLQGKKVHVITANDYLVKRDAEFAEAVFERFGITVGYIQSQLDPGGREGIRQAAYACDITFGTVSEFGFDYLRDNMKRSVAEQVQGRPDYAIIDEVDSLLIDEARTPLIISGPADDDVTRYPRADKVAADMVRKQDRNDRGLPSIVAAYDGDDRNIQKLDDAMKILGYHGDGAADAEGTGDADAPNKADGSKEGGDGLGALGPDFLTDDQVEAIQAYQAIALDTSRDDLYRRLFIVQRDRKQAQITHDGVTFAQEALDIGTLYAGANVQWPHLIENALRAHKVYVRDKDYVVQNGEVVIVDQFTGRLMPGRQWSDGLHQAIEAKEGVRVKQETQTLATITVQNYAHLYDKVSGMTGTALTEATEFMKIYALDVVEVPTNRPVNRMDYNDRIYKDLDEKYRGIVDEIHEIRRRGRPCDPFVIADALTALRPIHARLGRDTDRIDAALDAFHRAQFGDTKVLGFMLEVYDEQMGDLAVGRPVLVGTTSVENSEKISRLLDRTYGIEHEVLNAKNHAREAEIVVKAGQQTVPGGKNKTPLGNVTIATNMAGRGTDIKLGEAVVYPLCRVPVDGDGNGNGQSTEGVTPSTDMGASDDSSVSLPVIALPLYPPGTTKCCLRCEEYDPTTNCAHCFKPKVDPRFPDLGRNVCPINTPCGLHIVGSERHEARRIDNQLRGRAGRQGDPGSSRFFLSLEDDLLKLFMPDWMLKMMVKHAFEGGGAPLEMKQLTKGIEKAQRKVEERNFSIRKNLLEWDEPCDYQRKNFYDARQEVLEGHRLREQILEMIDQAVDEAVGKYLAEGYGADCIAEWCQSDLKLQIDAGLFVGSDAQDAQATIRATAKDDARESIRRSIGEYIDEDEERSSWDIGGLQSWAERAYRVAITKNQLRKMEPEEIVESLTEAAEAYYDHLNLDAVAKFTNPRYLHAALAEWARTRFEIELKSEQLAELPTEDVAENVKTLVREKYTRREIEYPVDYTLARTAAVGGADGAQVADGIVHWANAKYGLGWKLEDTQGQSLSDLRQRLVKINEEFLIGGRLEKEIDEALAAKQPEELREWAKKRFGPTWNEKLLDQGPDDARDTLVEMGRHMLTWELRILEHRVLLQLYDQMWKDHLLELDRLETSIKQRPLGGDQTHPQSQYAIEGRDLFQQMWARLRERIVDLILKIQAGPGGASGQAPRERELQMRHMDATGAGFAGAAADQESAMRAQGAPAKVETIRREQPKVGRNAPCPCGSGKKYKQCHGKT